jgi:hypothetical protein
MFLMPYAVPFVYQFLTLIWQRVFHIWFGVQVSGRARRDPASEGHGTQAEEEESKKGEGTSHSGPQVPYMTLLKGQKREMFFSPIVSYPG